MIGPVMLMIGL